jgi:hypothetical protein
MSLTTLVIIIFHLCFVTVDTRWLSQHQQLPQPVEKSSEGRQPDNQSGQKSSSPLNGGRQGSKDVRLMGDKGLDSVKLGVSDNDVLVHSLDMKSGLEAPQVTSSFLYYQQLTFLKSSMPLVLVEL